MSHAMMLRGCVRQLRAGRLGGACASTTKGAAATSARAFSGGYRGIDKLYEGQDYARQVEKKFAALSGKLPWEPDAALLSDVKRRWQSPEPNLNELVREDVPLARNLFRNVLQQHYPKDMGMWNKWAVMVRSRCGGSRCCHRRLHLR